MEFGYMRTMTEENVFMLDLSEEAAAERYELALERISSIPEEISDDAFRDYFSCIRDFVLRCDEEYRQGNADAAANARLYREWTAEAYPGSYLDPAFAVSRLGEAGKLLSAWYMEMQGLIPFIYEKRVSDMAVLLETAIQMACVLEDPENTDTDGGLKQVFYDYLYDDACDFAEASVREGNETAASAFARKIVMEADLEDTGSSSYLYRFGEWITEEELGTARLLGELSEEQIEKMAEAYVEGYIRGFAMTGKDISIKSTVLCDLPLGLERFMRAAVIRFEKAGLKVVFQRRAVRLLDKKLSGNVQAGFYGALHPQMMHDHREDLAFFWGDKLMQQKLKGLELAYEAHREALNTMSGRACVEIFGRSAGMPVTKAEAPAFTAHQQEVSRKYLEKAHDITERYMPDEETSYTIIAWPTPSIADAFVKAEEGRNRDRAYREIFEKIIHINTLPVEQWQTIQQRLIDALDRADTVEVLGRGDNCTNMKVQLHRLLDPAHQTNFENCLADVNIPAGEVFTSPLLKGTEGLLHVGYVYIDGYLFRDLRIRFSDGRVTDYECSYGNDREEGRKLIRQVLFGGRDRLPLGEFAIGTNTIAYTASRKYLIGDKMPVLIAEKTGPHFAVGDTCYSYEEEIVTCNPDGKQIIARENECSALRKTDPGQAYFHVHTDITIPYEELGSITAVSGQTRIALIENGRFVLPGTEALNEALEA